MLLTRDAGSAAGTSGSIPPMMLQRAVRRLRGLALAMVLIMTPGWLIPVSISSGLWREFSRPADWVPVTLAIVASALMYLVAGNQRLDPAAVARHGLPYMVIVSYGIAFGQYWDTFWNIPAEYMTFDRVGSSLVGPWMILFCLLVPNKPRHTLVALAAAAAAIPIVYGISMSLGRAPHLPAGKLAYVIVFPYALYAGVAYFGARVIHGLGADLKRATEMGAYRLEALIGRGGMGEVWRAAHRMLARPAAVKLVRADAIAGNDPARVGEAIKRFEREAQATAALTSHHTVELYDYGIADDGSCYYVMELLDGIDLETLVEKHGPLPAERVVALLRQVCHSLADAHGQGLIHRDVKPANIFLCRKGLDYDVVKVLDFGLVALQARPDEQDARLTADGRVAGTPAYLAPELAVGGEIDGRADVYALGCVAYWLLTGRLAFEAQTPAAAIVAHATKQPLPPSIASEVDISVELDQLVLRCLKKDPAQRPYALGLAAELERIPLEQPWTNERARAWWERHRPHAA